jgi:hypothetical protein
MAEMNLAPLENLHAGDIVYVDIRCYGYEWYDTLLTFLPDRFEKIYVVEYHVFEVYRNILLADCPTYCEKWRKKTGITALSSYWVFAYLHREFNYDTMVLITRDMCRENPVLISTDEKKQESVLAALFPQSRTSASVSPGK